MEYLFAISLSEFIKIIGYLGIFGIIFAESGLVIGFVFPGDSLLFTAGFLASQNYLHIVVLSLLTFSGAFGGGIAGYVFGEKIGPRVFRKDDALIFNRVNLEHAKSFYEKHGGKTILWARFLPVVRSFAPILAGAGKMKKSTFLFFNFLGSFIWGVGLPALGYYVGNFFPEADKYLLPIILAIIIISFLPSLFYLVRDKNERRIFFKSVSDFFKTRR